MDKATWMLGIIVPLISAAFGGGISLLIMRKLIMEERKKSKKERAIDINNDKIKSYKELFDLKKLKSLEIKLKITQYLIG